MKVLVLVGAGVVGFLVAFGFTAADEIGAEVDRKLDEDFVAQCTARAQFPAELKDCAPAICGCMKAQFDAKGYKLTDAFGEKRKEMREITGTCVALYR